MIANGVIFGPLNEIYSDRIIVGSRTLFLRAGEGDECEVGMGVEVAYTERADGRRDVDSIRILEHRRRPR